MTRSRRRAHAGSALGPRPTSRPRSTSSPRPAQPGGGPTSSSSSARWWGGNNGVTVGLRVGNLRVLMGLCAGPFLLYKCRPCPIRPLSAVVWLVQFSPLVAVGSRHCSDPVRTCRGVGIGFERLVHFDRRNDRWGTFGHGASQ